MTFDELVAVCTADPSEEALLALQAARETYNTLLDHVSELEESVTSLTDRATRAEETAATLFKYASADVMEKQEEQETDSQPPEKTVAEIAELWR